MRVLFVCMPHPTHWQPMAPLAWALRAAGHEVRVAGQPELAEAVTGSGLTAVPIGTEHWYAADPHAPGLLGELLVAGGSEHVQDFDWAGEDPAAWEHESLLGLEHVLISALFAAIGSDSAIDDLVAFTRSWRPDLVIWEQFTLAGAVAATAAGVAHARFVYGPDITLRARRAFLERTAELEPEHREDPTADWLSSVLARFGRDYDETVRTGHFTVDVTPPSTRLDLDRPTVDLRYTPYNGPAVLPGWLAEPVTRPRVCLTLGVSDEVERSGATPADILAGIADLDVEVVATLGAEQRARLGNVGANTRIVDFVPLHDLLPSCAAIVHHGGVGTRATAEAHGVPQLIIGYGWDTRTKAARNQELGAGLYLPDDRADVASVRAAVLRLLEDPSIHAGARKLRDETAALPTPAAVVPTLVGLAERHRGVGA
ncbi:activator-dependent family glycosyltransferase [Actinokineospora sp. PR83]|uniref:activator-dependent family glycosyltransferase n=1 Tax=Actinokineospora sp. PR83 TaxID=2884908 RepID=UPI001F3E28B0|nr:activator-dependent family glycosyltransferase [Actinokineospora sp. PR83]MCG8918357.1 activator-dependent family glycosyltransferase [Actinokineospora sp. PR83]